jgi:hypothetical protein
VIMSCQVLCILLEGHVSVTGPLLCSRSLEVVSALLLFDLCSASICSALLGETTRRHGVQARSFFLDLYEVYLNIYTWHYAIPR